MINFICHDENRRVSGSLKHWQSQEYAAKGKFRKFCELAQPLDQCHSREQASRYNQVTVNSGCSETVSGKREGLHRLRFFCLVRNRAEIRLGHGQVSTPCFRLIPIGVCLPICNVTLRPFAFYIFLMVMSLLIIKEAIVVAPLLH